MAERENLEVVKNAYAAFLKGDIGAVIAACAEDVVWTIPGLASVPVAGTRRGREGVAEFFRTLGENQTPQEFQPREFVANGDSVVALGHYSWTIRRTGRTYASEWAHAFTLREGRVVKFREYSDTAAEAEAYAA